MEGNNGSSEKQGAYAPVTAPIAPSDEKAIPPKTETEKEGTSIRKKRLILLILLIVLAVITIAVIVGVIFAVANQNKGKLKNLTEGSMTSSTVTPTVAESRLSSSMANESMTMMTPAPAPPTTTPTPGPPVPGSFNGYMVLDLPYKDSYDDVRDSERAQLVASFTTAVNELYTNTTVYQGVTVSALLKTTSAKVQVEFEISVSDISKGARLILVDALSPLRSKLNTYTILEMAINTEEATGTGQETDG